MKSLRIGDIEIFWLHGGVFELDGGAMFGSVPKVLWEKRYPVSEGNNIRLQASPLLVRTPEKLLLIDTGLGNKLNDKQKKIFRVQEEWRLVADLAGLGIGREEIDFVILTHGDFDHAGGVVMHGEGGAAELTFPNAVHLLQESEWEDIQAPNMRSANTYWPHNFAQLRDSEQLRLVAGSIALCSGVRLRHTGGHTRGHQIVEISSAGESAFHLADLLPTHHHQNPLWIMAYDNFPLAAIAAKGQGLAAGRAVNAWFTFYHDPFLCACRFGAEGQVTEQFINL